MFLRHDVLDLSCYFYLSEHCFKKLMACRSQEGVKTHLHVSAAGGMLRSECWVQKPAAHCRSLLASKVGRTLGWMGEGIAGKTCRDLSRSVF